MLRNICEFKQSKATRQSFINVVLLLVSEKEDILPPTFVRHI